MPSNSRPGHLSEAEVRLSGSSFHAVERRFSVPLHGRVFGLDRAAARAVGWISWFIVGIVRRLGIGTDLFNARRPEGASQKETRGPTSPAV